MYAYMRRGIPIQSVPLPVHILVLLQLAHLDNLTQVCWLEQNKKVYQILITCLLYGNNKHGFMSLNSSTD